MPGEVWRSTSTCQSSAARPASSASSRRAAASAVLAGDVEQAGGQLVRGIARTGWRYWLHQHDPSVVVERDDRHRAGVLDDLARTTMPSLIGHLVGAQGHDPAAVDRGRGDNGDSAGSVTRSPRLAGWPR